MGDVRNFDYWFNVLVKTKVRQDKGDRCGIPKAQCCKSIATVMEQSAFWHFGCG